MTNEATPGNVPLDDQLGLSPMERLLAFCEWERTHNPHPEGKPHVAEWAAGEIKRLRGRVLELEAAHDDASGAVAAVLERIAGEPPISGNTLAQARVLMAAAKFKGPNAELRGRP